MKKKILAVILATCYILICNMSVVMALPGGMDHIVIENFDNYFTDKEVYAEVLGGSISAQKDMEAIYKLSDEFYYDGGQSLGLGGIYREIPGEMHGMVFPTITVPGSKSNWSDAQYIQFWVKNEMSVDMGIRLEVTDINGKSHSLPDWFEVLFEKRPGEDVWVTSTGHGSKRVFIPMGYEGFVRVPLSLYSTLTNYVGISKLSFNMSALTASGEYMYIDSIMVTTDAYKNPKPKKYPPEFNNTFLRIDENENHLIFTTEVDSDNEIDSLDLTVFAADGTSLGTQVFETDDEHYAKCYYKLPENIAPGQYKIVARVNDNPNGNLEYVFPIYKMEPTTYADVWNTNYEQAVELLSKMGIITGYDDGTFRPEKTITRAEFSALMVRILGMEERAKQLTSAPFNDTAGHWAAGNIAVGVEQGIINGYGDGRFGPDDTVTYEQAMKMVVAALGYGADAEAAGGYPDGYMAVGKNDLRLEYKMYTDNPTAVRGNIAILLRNAIAEEIKVDGKKAHISLMNKNFEKKMDELRYEAVKNFGDLVLKYDKDNYGIKETPAFIDGINIFTMQPAVFIAPQNKVKSIVSNFTGQQVTLKILDSLTKMTGDPKYKERALEATKYTLDNHVDDVGTLVMGGHASWNAFTEAPSWGKGFQLEMKDFYPYYDFWFEADPERASKAIGGIWDSKMTDWSVLNFTRHGKLNKSPSKIWDNEFADPDPWYKVGLELGFYMSAADLMYSAYKEYQHAGNDKARLWADRLLGMYQKASDPVTGLIPDIYTLSGGNTVTDRGLDQFGVDFPQEQYGFRATEGNYQTHLTTTDSVAALVELYDLGIFTQEQFDFIVKEHIGYIKYQYDKEARKEKPVFADGTDLTGYTIKTTGTYGYFGQEGTVLGLRDMKRDLVWNFIALYLRSGEKELWDFARDMADLYDLGDIGTAPGENVNLNFATKSCTQDNVFAMVDLYEKTGCEDYLKMAKAISNNSMIMMKRGFFMTLYEKAYMYGWEDDGTRKWNKVYAKFDPIDAHAMLRIQEVLEGRSGTVPVFIDTYGNQIDDFYTIDRTEVSENTAIFMGEYDIDAIIDKIK